MWVVRSSDFNKNWRMRQRVENPLHRYKSNMPQCHGAIAVFILCAHFSACTSSTAPVGSASGGTDPSHSTGGAGSEPHSGGTNAIGSTGSPNSTGGRASSSDAGQCPPRSHAAFEYVDCCLDQPCRGLCADDAGHCACGSTIGGCLADEICCRGTCGPLSAASECVGPPP